MDAQFAELPLAETPADAEETGSPLSPLVDEVAINLARAKAGEAEGFRQLLRLHSGRVFSIALRFTGRRTEAEELAQDVFVQLHGALAQIESPAHLLHWLLRTVSHRCIDRQRSEKRRPRLVSIESAHDVADTTADPGDPLAGARLRRMLLELAADARAVMLLRFQEDMDPTDIARALGMSVNTVKSHLRRSLETLRAQYSGDRHGN